MSGDSISSGIKGVLDYGIDLKLESYEEENYYILQMCEYFNEETEFKALEDAHVIGQHSTFHHTRVHYEMLKFGLKRKDTKEVFGQLFRLIGAVTKTAIGLLPEGNTGGANVSPFKPMPISQANKAILDEIKHAQS